MKTQTQTKARERGYRCELLSNDTPIMAQTLVATSEADAAEQMIAIGHAITLPGDTVRVQALACVAVRA